MFTALLIAILIVVGAATVVGGGLVLATKRRKELARGSSALQLGEGSTGDQLLERGLRDLRVDDVVQLDGRDFLVEGVIRYDEAGHGWIMGRLVDGRDMHWLLVGLERTGGTITRLLDTADDFDLHGYPPELLVRGETRYRFDKRGTATTTLHGATGTLASGGEGAKGTVHRCRWWSYEAPGGECLLVEQWGDDYRVLAGRKVSDTEVEMMPGS